MAGTVNNREKILAVITVLVIIGALVFSVVIEPQLKKRQSSLARMNQLQLKLARMKGDLLIKDRIDAVYAQIEPLIAGDGTDQQEKSRFTRELGELYSKLDVTITSTTILPTVNEDFYRRLSAKIQMHGNVREIFRFILAVESHCSPIRIEQFDFKAREIADNVNATFLVTKVVADSKI
jgi:Tfp pilus assembly protein PilO